MSRQVRLLEAFAGSRSVGKQGERLGMDVFSIDIKPFKGISLVADIEFVTPEMIPWTPDVMWFSPPCTTYSLAAISHHRHESGEPKTDFAAKSDRMIQNVIRLIEAFPEAIYYIENPRATLRNMEFMRSLPDPVTVWYCRYGDKRAKPTDIWTNNLRSLFNPHGWAPRPQCWNGNKSCHHEAAPRGAKTGTQGLKNDYERSKIPADLCMDVLLSSVNITPKQ
jgi:hypothetical protein